MGIVVQITSNNRDSPPSKLADAELHFAGGVLDGADKVGDQFLFRESLL